MSLSEITTVFRGLQTPFYFYDMDLLGRTLDEVRIHGISRGYHIHFALKANHQVRVLEKVLQAGLGADCVSGGEINRAIEAGFSPSDIAFAGVGKSDEEINIALEHDIFCFNCESPQELEVINALAARKGIKARIALRLNPDVDAKTHKYITTGLNENKFGINEEDLDQVLDMLPSLEHIAFSGIHFHIGSQIQDMEPFIRLCSKVNDLSDYIESKGFEVRVINVGGGFGIDYEDPDTNSIPDFERFFGLFSDHLRVKAHQEVHFELGRSIVGQCGNLITKVLYTKKGRERNFAIVDAGMTELIRPALYQASHHIEVLTSDRAPRVYDVVGPICESSDTFRKDITLPEVVRGDLLAIRSCGAYGEVMKSEYNLRPRISALYSDEVLI